MQITCDRKEHAEPVCEVVDEARACAAGFATLGMDLHNAPGLDEIIVHVARFASQTVPCEFTGVVLRDRRNRYHTAGACDPRAAAADELQIACGEGPWLSQDSTHHSILIHDTADDPRWRRWGPRVARIGLRSLLSIRLSIGRSETGRSELGFLNFYSASPGRLAGADNEVACLLACHTAIAIDSAQEAATLARALEARTVVGQAQGILMAQFAMDAAQAFAVLRRYSQDANLKLHDVARRLIETRQLPTYHRNVPPRSGQDRWRGGRWQYYDSVC